MHSAEIKTKLLKTIDEKYNTDNVMKNPIIKSKNKNSNIKNNGEFHTRCHISKEVIQKLDDIEWLNAENISKTPLQISADLGVSPTTIYKIFDKHNVNYIHHYSTSKWQSEVVNYIKSLYNDDIIENNRTILHGKELDIVLPLLKLAFECNGVLWHSELKGRKDKNYHLSKSTLAEESGYKLIHLFDNDWATKNSIIKSRISGLLGVNNKIHARNTQIRELDKNEESAFFDKTHQQGYVASNKCFGLFYESELVAAMSFSKSRFNKQEYELLRFSSELFINVAGGASKLFSAFLLSCSPTSVISYSHKTFGISNLYTKLGFIYSHTSVPAYHYTKNYHAVENRMKYQKHKLEKLLPVFDNTLTEWENMQNNGYDRIWDCGNDVWVWKDK